MFRGGWPSESLVDGDAEALGAGGGGLIDEGAKLDGDDRVLIGLVGHAEVAGEVATREVGLSAQAGALRRVGAEEEGVLGDGGAAIAGEGLGGRRARGGSGRRSAEHVAEVGERGFDEVRFDDERLVGAADIDGAGFVVDEMLFEGLIAFDPDTAVDGAEVAPAGGDGVSVDGGGSC